MRFPKMGSRASRQHKNPEQEKGSDTTSRSVSKVEEGGPRPSSPSGMNKPVCQCTWGRLGTDSPDFGTGCRHCVWVAWGRREMGSFCHLPLARDARGQPLGASIGQRARSQLFVDAQVKGKRSLRSGTLPRGMLHTTGESRPTCPGLTYQPCRGELALHALDEIRSPPRRVLFRIPVPPDE